MKSIKVYLKLWILSIIFFLLSCGCPEPSQEPFYGTWYVADLHNSDISKYDDTGYIVLKVDNTFNSNFSYFFTLDSSNADSQLSGTWDIDYGCYQHDYEYKHIVLKTNIGRREWSYRFSDSKMKWSTSNAKGLDWKRKD